MMVMDGEILVSLPEPPVLEQILHDMYEHEEIVMITMQILVHELRKYVMELAMTVMQK